MMKKKNNNRILLVDNEPDIDLAFKIGLDVALDSGFSIISKDDYDNMTKQFYVYDALYAFCKSDNNNKEKLLTSRH